MVVDHHKQTSRDVQLENANCEATRPALEFDSRIDRDETCPQAAITVGSSCPVRSAGGDAQRQSL